jgi:hypothetical protein
MRTNGSSFVWAVGGTLVLLAAGVLVWRFHTDPTQQVALKAQSVELVQRVSRDLAAASEAEKSAVLAVTDRDSQVYADEARATTARVEEGRADLGALLVQRGTPKEKDLFAQFSKAFSEFQRVDKELLALAVRNTNLKASALAFGPAASAVKEMDAALSRLLAQNAASSSANSKSVVLLAAEAEIAVLRIEVLLPPHISEESDKKMDELEAAMAKQDDEVRKSLDRLASLLPQSKDVETAQASYSRFNDTRRTILKLSRENTNVRSLSISLNEKRKVMVACQDALAALEKSIQEEPIPGVAAPVRPR